MTSEPATWTRPGSSAPQKGADPATVARLSDRLIGHARSLRQRFGCDIAEVSGSGAAGGLAGGLIAAGAEVRAGLELVADRLQLDRRLAGVELVITAEGRLDASSLAGKVIGGLIERSPVPVWVIAGSVADDLAVAAGQAARLIDLTARYGSEAAHAETERWLIAAAREIVAGFGSSGW